MLNASLGGVAYARGLDASSEVATASWDDVALTICFVTLNIITILGNALIIIAVLTTPKLRTVTNQFILSLGFADFLVGICVLPPAIMMFITDDVWYLGWILCDTWIFLDMFLCTGSILSLCAISIDRYLAISRPITYSRRWRSKRLAVYICLGMWILSFLITCPPLFGWSDPDRHGDDQTECKYNENSGYVVYSAMGSFYLPTLVILYTYASIIYVVQTRNKEFKKQSALHITNAVEAAAMPTLPSQRPSLRRTSSTFARAAPPRMARGKSVSAMGTTVTSRKTDRSVSCDESSRLQALNSYRQRSPRSSNFAVGRLILTADDGGAGNEDATADVVGNGGVVNGLAGVNWHFVDFTADAKQSSNGSENEDVEKPLTECCPTCGHSRPSDGGNPGSILHLSYVNGGGNANGAAAFNAKNSNGVAAAVRKFAKSPTSPSSGGGLMSARSSQTLLGEHVIRSKSSKGRRLRSASERRRKTGRVDNGDFFVENATYNSAMSSADVAASSLTVKPHHQTSSWLRRHSREFGRKVSRDLALLGGLTGGGGSGEASSAAVAASTEHHNKRRAHNREARTAKRLAVVVAAFITCWLPFFVSYVARPFHAERLIPGGVYTFLTWLGWGNSAINPFLYAAYSPSFRAAFFDLTIGKMRKICARVGKCCGCKCCGCKGTGVNGGRATTGATGARSSLVGVVSNQEIATQSFSGTTRATGISDLNAINSESSS